MIPTIGIMIGAYIFTRMVSFATRGGDRKESLLVRVLAILTMIVTMFCTADLLLRGASFPSRAAGGLGGTVPAFPELWPKASRSSEPVAAPNYTGANGACQFTDSDDQPQCADMTKRVCEMLRGTWRAGHKCQ